MHSRPGLRSTAATTPGDGSGSTVRGSIAGSIRSRAGILPRAAWRLREAPLPLAGLLSLSRKSKQARTWLAHCAQNIRTTR
jgi:hypothetical protein